MEVQAGTTRAGQQQTGSQFRRAKKWIRPTQSSFYTGKDFGLIKVYTPFTFNWQIRKIKLCGSYWSYYCGPSVLYTGKLLYAAGFGRRGTSSSGYLKYASMYLQSDASCKAQTGHSRVRDHHICTKGNKKTKNKNKKQSKILFLYLC